MRTEPNTLRRAGSETGMMPRIDLEQDTRPEAPEPQTLPEFHDDGAGITGTIPVIAPKTEGEDLAKQADDSATAV